MKKMTKLFGGLAITFACLLATPAFADGDSWVNGNVDAGATVMNGMGSFNAGYQGDSGTMSWNNWYGGIGTTQVGAGGSVNGYVDGGFGSAMGYANSGANAIETGWSTHASSGSSTGSSATSWNGTSSSSTNAGAGGSAQSGGIVPIWW